MRICPLTSSSKQERLWDGTIVPVETFEDGRRVYAKTFTSVTSVLGKVFGPLFPEQAAANVEYARARGTEFHRTLSLLSGSVPGQTANMETIDPEVRPRVDLVRGWMARVGWKPAYVEKAFVHRALGYGGTPDQVGTMVPHEDRLVVLDFKPMRAPLVRLQLAGYALMVKDSLRLPGVVRRISLHVDGNRCVPVEHEKHARDRDMWFAALSCYRYGQEEKIWL